ncbi:MAG: hypothetical protein EBU46_00495 [Nitrosomonadaceae bacterium]|nr:hypothetical protein [Nitrosomonadaceae bacterium]
MSEPLMNRPQALVLQKLCSYFGLQREKVKVNAFNASDESMSLIVSPVLADIGFDKVLRCVELKAFNLNRCITWAKFSRSDIYTEFLNGEQMFANPQHNRKYMLAFYGGGVGWFVYRGLTGGYRGDGAWVLRNPEDNGILVLEPIANYLTTNHPKEAV